MREPAHSLSIRRRTAWHPYPATRWPFPAIGSRLWEHTAPGRIHETPVVASDGAILRIEDDAIVSRDPATGAVTGSFAAPTSSGLQVMPWGDLAFSQGARQGQAAVRCPSRTGEQHWSVPLDGSAPGAYRPFALGDLVVIARRGGLWAYNRGGTPQWVARPGEVLPARSGDDA